MSFSNRDYQREHLRAPYKEELLYSEGKHVYKGSCLNISCGGILLDQISYFPEDEKELFIYVKVPYLPFFKSFNLEKLRSYSKDLFDSTVISFKCEIVRRADVKTNLDGIFSTRLACKLIEIDEKDRGLIDQYVDHFASNLIYLQTLIQMLNSDQTKLQFIKELCPLLGYDPHMKISLLAKKVDHDYRSLQWL